MRKILVYILSSSIILFGGCRHSDNSTSQLDPNSPEAQVDQDKTPTKAEKRHSKSKSKEPVDERVLVPGGLNDKAINRLWKVAKTKCFEMRYIVANEDKETGNLVCTSRRESGDLMITINFNSQGFLVTANGVIADLGFSAAKNLDKKAMANYKIQMDDALKTASGVNK